MSFFDEIKRRKVGRVAVVYAATAFAVLQAADILLPNLGAPPWVMRVIVLAVLLGFPVALVLAWAFELTPDRGVERTSAAPDADPGETPSLLNTRSVFAAGLLIAVGIGLSAGWVLKPATPPGLDGAADGPPSIAVLPFADLSPEGDQEYFSDGLAEEILNLLATVRDLSVASRTSAFSFKGSSASIPEIGQALGVRYVLEGSVRKSDARLRITAQLVDVRTDRQVWSDTYDRTLADVFAMQDEIAAAIGDELEVRLLGADGETVAATEIAPELYETFLQSRFLIRQRNQAALARAVELLEEVVAGEPDYAPGLAQLAEALLVSGGIDDENQLERHLDRILGLVERALAIDSRLPGAFAVRGNVAMTRDRRVDAYRDYRRAIELDAEDPRPRHWLGILYSEAGYLELAEHEIAESLRLDPDNANAEGWRAEVLAARGRWAEVGASGRRVVELGNPFGHVTAAFSLLALDARANLEQAEAEIRLAATRGTPSEQVPLKLIDVARGDEAALASFLDDTRRNRTTLYVATGGLMALDRSEAVLTLLEWPDFLFERLSPAVWAPGHAQMRSDPRFVAYLERIGTVALWREIGPPPDCVAEGDGYRCGRS